MFMKRSSSLEMSGAGASSRIAAASSPTRPSFSAADRNSSGPLSSDSSQRRNASKPTMLQLESMIGW